MGTKCCWSTAAASSADLRFRHKFASPAASCLSQFDGIHVVSGSLDTSIRVWDVETGNCIHTLTGHQSLTSGMELKDNILVSGNADSTVKIWDIKTGQCLQTLQGEREPREGSRVTHQASLSSLSPFLPRLFLLEMRLSRQRQKEIKASWGCRNRGKP